MKYTLKCENGKEIDMSFYIGKQMDGDITRQDVLGIIETNKQCITN